MLLNGFIHKIDKHQLLLQSNVLKLMLPVQLDPNQRRQISTQSKNKPPFIYSGPTTLRHITGWKEQNCTDLTLCPGRGSNPIPIPDPWNTWNDYFFLTIIEY